MTAHERNKDNDGLLTSKEREVLSWVKHGKSTSDIASILKISQSTVKYHIGNIMDKLNASNRAHAVAIAMEKGLFDGE